VDRQTERLLRLPAILLIAVFGLGGLVIVVTLLLDGFAR
jgi:hypothetical protein